MKQDFKLLIVHISTIENEKEDSINSIKNQTYTNYDIRLIENKGKVEAHNEMYSYFTRHTEYDLLVKVDGDMVITKNNFFNEVIKHYKKIKASKIIVPVFDYYTNDYIAGLNIFDRTTKWILNSDNIFTDRKDINSSPSYRANILKHYVLHCPNPNNKQSFHYGLQRGFKAFMPGIKKSGRHYGSFLPIKKVVRQYKLNKDLNRYYALMGFYTCMTNFNLNSNVLSYGDEFENLINSIKIEKVTFNFLNNVITKGRLTYYLYWSIHRIHSFTIKN
ncbi:MAG: hypothetical protein ACQESQ_04925 [Bacteroidota bacterium]